MQEVHLKIGKGKCCRIPLLAGGLRIQKKRWLWWGGEKCGTVARTEFVQHQLLYTDKSLIQWLQLHTWVDKKNEEQDWTSYMVEILHLQKCTNHNATAPSPNSPHLLPMGGNNGLAQMGATPSWNILKFSSSLMMICMSLLTTNGKLGPVKTANFG
jgi:hypothetical protein